MIKKKITKISDLKIFFMGTPFLAKEIFSNLLQKNIPINTVITRLDKPVGRKQEKTSSEVKLLALRKDIRIEQFEKIDKEALNFFCNEKPDIIIVAAYGMILPKELLKILPYGAINVHASLLPKYRGASPIQKVLLEGEKETGISVMLMDEKMDTGDILFQKKVAIHENDKYPALEKRLIVTSNEILVSVLQNWIAGKIKPVSQNNSYATYTKIIEKKDGRINWEKTAEEIYNQFRAFYLWPKIYTSWKKKKLALTEIALLKNSQPVMNPGKIEKDQNEVIVGTKKGQLVLKKVQLEGKKELPIKDFINGHSDFIGSIFSNQNFFHK